MLAGDALSCSNPIPGFSNESISFRHHFVRVFEKIAPNSSWLCQCWERSWRQIEKAAKGSAGHPPDWKADAWSLERVYPQLFGRPDLQLSVNQSVSTGPTNVVVLGPERARVLATRHEQIRARPVALFEKAGKGEPNGKLL